MLHQKFFQQHTKEQSDMFRVRRAIILLMRATILLMRVIILLIRAKCFGPERANPRIVIVTTLIENVFNYVGAKKYNL